MAIGGREYPFIVSAFAHAQAYQQIHRIAKQVKKNQFQKTVDKSFQGRYDY
jgi:hypothetical protein